MNKNLFVHLSILEKERKKTSSFLSIWVSEMRGKFQVFLLQWVSNLDNRLINIIQKNF